MLALYSVPCLDQRRAERHLGRVSTSSVPEHTFASLLQFRV